MWHSAFTLRKAVQFQCHREAAAWNDATPLEQLGCAPGCLWIMLAAWFGTLGLHMAPNVCIGHLSPSVLCCADSALWKVGCHCWSLGTSLQCHDWCCLIANLVHYDARGFWPHLILESVVNSFTYWAWVEDVPGNVNVKVYIVCWRDTEQKIVWPRIWVGVSSRAS